MVSDKKTDKTIAYFVVGGAVIGAIAGYIVKKVGVQNIINVLKAKKILSESVANTISEFTTKEIDEDLEEDSED
ncbi:MAG: hypothetical protein FJW61_00820 [Actinobacteria bacterium]|nr:hypothetical protein [Actinomycetota bacterium]